MPHRRLPWLALAGLFLCLGIVCSIFIYADVSRVRFSPAGPYPEYERDAVAITHGSLAYARYRSHERVVWYGHSSHPLAPGTSWHLLWDGTGRPAARSMVEAVAYAQRLPDPTPADLVERQS